MDCVKLVNDALDTLRKEGAIFKESGGKTLIQVNPVQDNPWNFTKKQTMDCMLWKDFLCGVILKELPKEEHFVPSYCANCYKVVIRPETFSELLELEALLKSLNYSSKCGIEVRPFVKGLYGGYFYTEGLDKGLQRLKEIQEYYPDATLKRGCTEFEMNHGPSDKWEVTTQQLELERTVGEMVGIYGDDLIQDLGMVHQKWMDWAYKFDKTFVHELYPKCITYDNIHNSK